jgi:hypothetical protein
MGLKSNSLVSATNTVADLQQDSPGDATAIKDANQVVTDINARITLWSQDLTSAQSLKASMTINNETPAAMALVNQLIAQLQSDIN